MNAETIEKKLNYPCRLVYFDSVPSTNDTAKELAASGAPEGTLVVAASQTSGRGRMGKSFFSPGGTGVYLSLVLRPRGEDALKITTLAAVTTSEAIEKVTGKVTGIKWVNDLFLDGKKVCGILAEAVRDYVVLGIGIDLFEPEDGFGELADIAGGILPYLTADDEMLSRLAAETANCFFKRYSGGITDFYEEYREKLFIMGKELTVTSSDGTETVTAADLDSDFRLIVRGKDGSERTLFSGEVSLKL